MENNNMMMRFIVFFTAFLFTANLYAFGTSEEFVGKLGFKAVTEDFKYHNFISEERVVRAGFSPGVIHITKDRVTREVLLFFGPKNNKSYINIIVQAPDITTLNYILNSFKLEGHNKDATHVWCDVIGVKLNLSKASRSSPVICSAISYH